MGSRKTIRLLLGERKQCGKGEERGKKGEGKGWKLLEVKGGREKEGFI